MTTSNRLAKSEKPRLTMTAAEWAAEARERGYFNKAKLWDERAAELGEQDIPEGKGVRFRDDGATYLVDLVRALPPSPKHVMDRDRSRFTAADWAELNAHLESTGSSVRYRADGSRL